MTLRTSGVHRGTRRHGRPTTATIPVWSVAAICALTWIGLALALPGAALAGDDPVVAHPDGADARNERLSFAEMHVQVWPEYDAPEVLVLSDFTLPAGQDLPVSFVMAVPKGARITAMGEVTEDESYVAADGPPGVDRSGDEWDIAHLEFSDHRRLRLEYYYDPGLNLDGQREFELTYEFPGAAANTILAVQQPSRSTAFEIEPALDRSVDDPGGFTYAVHQTMNVEGGDRYSVSVRYVKSDAEPSVTEAEATEASPAATKRNFFAVMAVVGAASVGAAVWSVREKARRSQRLCAQCAAEPSDPDDAFCVSCGHPRGPE